MRYCGSRLECALHYRSECFISLALLIIIFVIIIPYNFVRISFVTLHSRHLNLDFFVVTDFLFSLPLTDDRHQASSLSGSFTFDTFARLVEDAFLTIPYGFLRLLTISNDSVLSLPDSLPDTIY